MSDAIRNSVAVMMAALLGGIVVWDWLSLQAPDHWDRLDTFAFGLIAGALGGTFIGRRSS